MRTIWTGQLSTSLTVFSRTVDDYSSWAKKELIPARKEKAFERLKIFRDEVSDYRGVFDKLKKERDQAVGYCALLLSNREPRLPRGTADERPVIIMTSSLH